MAKDSITRLKAQILAEAGVPLSAISEELGVARRSLQRWSEDADWKTPWKINQLFEKLQLNDRLTNWMMGPKGPLRVRLMYDYLVSGAEDYEAAFSAACADADRQSENWREGSVFPVPRAPLTESVIGASYRLQTLGIDPETPVRQPGTVIKRTPDDLSQQGLDDVTGVSNLRANVEEIGANWQESRGNGGELRVDGAGGGGFGAPNSLSPPTSGQFDAPNSLPRATSGHFDTPTPPNCDNLTHPAGLISPELPHNLPPSRPVSRSNTSPLDILVRPTEQLRQTDTPAQKLRQSVTVANADAGVCGIPVEDFVPTIGEKDRAAGILEVLPRDFEGFVQVVRDSESLGRTMTSRAGVFQDNVSATLLKLSQYALQLAETDPRKALIVMTQISKLASTGQKTFKLDEEKDANKNSDAMRRLAQKEEDGEDSVVLDV